MELDFPDWTAYDNWLIQNYAEFSVYDIVESEGNIHIKYCLKGDFVKIKEENKT